MAILNAPTANIVYHQVDMNNATFGYGNVTVADTGHIQITDGTHLQDYYGTFSYDTSGYLSGGTITSTDYFESGVKFYGLTDEKLNVLTVYNYLLSGNASRLLSYVYAGNDTLNGSPENDVLNGYAGSNTLIGGLGNDEYFVGKLDTVIENQDGGTDTINSKLTYLLPDNVENLNLLGNASINGTGNGLDNTLTGNNGANVLDGGAGADTMIGGKGNDTYFLDNAGDTVEESSNGGKDLVKSSLSLTSLVTGSNLENLTLMDSAGKSTGIGNELNNIITGNNADNILDGASGADTLIGGAGNDIYMVDLKITGVGALSIAKLEDTIKETAANGTDTVQLRGSADLSKASTLSLAANLENLDASHTGNTLLNLKGNALANILTGNDADNILTGGAGNDTLIGGDGSNLLIGGKGQDTYNINIAATDTVRIAKGDSLVGSFDVVNGFKLGKLGEDKLDLASNKIAANADAVDGIDKGLIHSHHIADGLITFGDNDSYTNSLAITTNNFSDVVAYLQANITGSNTVAFNSQGNTYVFQDGGANDTLVQLTGVNASALSTDWLL
jgi:Ca2+-binding RTX toxin-like protein